MEIRTSQTKKTRKYFRIISLFGLLIGVSFPMIAQADFTQNLKDMGVNIKAMQDKKGISRYDTAKLLNASECNDCILPDQETIDRYKISFWNEFSIKPGKYFNDISYLGGIYNEQSYYHCVAYVGENNYMNGYPISTSPICAGRFCGAQHTTKAEFLQIVINLLAKYIYPDIQIDRGKAQKRVEKLKTDSYEYRTLTVDDRTIISENNGKCKEEKCYLTEATQVQTYLKYCMFNLSSCDMEVMGNIKQGAWPIAELNLLRKQNIISRDAKIRKDIGAMIDGETVINILSKIHGKIQCQSDKDYDCDGIENIGDSCANDYNPTQTDTDNDKIGDVCDDDIDGDGIKNPIGVVDDNGRINIKVRTQNMDNCLFIVNPDQKSSKGMYIGDICNDEDKLDQIGIYIHTKEISSDAPVTVDFDAITQGKVDKVVRNISDGSQMIGQQMTHTFLTPGIYRVQASAQNTKQQASAHIIIKIGGISEIQAGLQTNTAKVGSYNPGVFSFQASALGKADKIERIIDDKAPITKDPDQSLTTILDKTGSHQIIVKAYYEGMLLAVNIFTIGIGEYPGSILRSNMLNPEIDQKISLQTSTFDIKTNDISYIQWDFGDGKIERNKLLDTNHSYKTAGKKTIIQKIVLIDGSTIHTMITIFVIDKNLLRSFALLLVPDKMISSIGETIKFTIYQVGDSWENIQGYMMKYSNKRSEYLTGKQKLPFISPYSYETQNNYSPSISAALNQCDALQAQISIAIDGKDICLDAIRKGVANKIFRCDMDQDNIPDICDDDIDGDGVKNLIGLIKYEQKNCIYDGQDTNNINTDLLHDHFQNVCSLDNAPFRANKDQTDLNGDGIGDIDTSFKKIENDDDIDNDGIVDQQDICPLVHGMGNLKGCPEISSCLPQEPDDIQDTGGFTEDSITGTSTTTTGTSTTTTGISTTTTGTSTTTTGTSTTTTGTSTTTTKYPPIIQSTCNQCPCQYSDLMADISNKDQVQAILGDTQKSNIYNYSLPRIINF